MYHALISLIIDLPLREFDFNNNIIMIVLRLSMFRRNEGAMKVLEFLSKEEDDGPDERRRGQYIAMAATSCLRRLHSWLSPNVREHYNFPIVSLSISSLFSGEH